MQDLKGKVIATNAAGSAVDVATRAMLRKAGLEDKRDYTVLETPFPTMRAMLAEKKVDMIPGVLPFSLDPELRKIAKPVFTQREAIGETEMIIWTVRKPFLDKNRAAMVDFMEDTLRIVRWYLDPTNQKEAAEIASRVTKQPAERFGWLFTQNDYYRDPTCCPDLVALQRNLDMTTDLGFVKAKVDVNKHVDLSHRQRGGEAAEVGRLRFADVSPSPFARGYAISHRARLQRLLVPDQQAAAQDRHGLDQDVADRSRSRRCRRTRRASRQSARRASWRRRGRSRPSASRRRSRR